jgi:NADH-quinone oxidoreductase subunit J
MILHAIAFYLFAGLAVAAALLVVSARNPVHSVLFLILAFFNAAGLFVLAGAEFLALILVIVYVGAVAVLFLFVVMMLDIDFAELRRGFLKHLPFGVFVGVVLFAELTFVLVDWDFAHLAPDLAAAPMPPEEALTNAEALGRVLYTQYVFYFQIAGLILLVAMMGAVVLTLRRREGLKRQKITRQVGRTATESIELKKLKPGQGV